VADDDWYRSTSWDEGAQREFEKRLGRARAHNRSQYIRIKATSLASVGELDGAQLLLERLLAEYGNDQLQAPMARYQLGELLEQRGRLDEAENEYRRVIEIHDETGRRYGLPELRLAELLLSRGSRLAYQDALAHLTRELPDMLLKSHRFRGATAVARMHRALGNHDEARVYAATALKIAQETQPLLPRHPSLDSDWYPDPETLSELRTLAT
jgi:tetratricopeptide (TPR) repeat protein